MSLVERRDESLLRRMELPRDLLKVVYYYLGRMIDWDKEWKEIHCWEMEKRRDTHCWMMEKKR